MSERDKPIEDAMQALGDACKSHRFRLRASIPATDTDHDVVIAKGLGYAKRRIAELEDIVSDWVQSTRRANGETCERGTLGEFLDEHHCGCVGLLRNRIAELERERDEAQREAARNAQARDEWKFEAMRAVRTMRDVADEWYASLAYQQTNNDQQEAKPK